MTVQPPLAPSDHNQSQPLPASEFVEHSRSSATPGIDLVVLLRILRVRKNIILGTAAIVTALTILILANMTPLYSASSIVMLDKQKNTIEDVTSILTNLATDTTGIQNQIQILTSRDLAGRVIDKLNLKDSVEYSNRGNWGHYLSYVNPLQWLPRFGKSKTIREQSEIERNNLIDRFENNLTVTPVGLSSAIKVTYASAYSNEAARIDNAIADAYVEDQLNAKFEATQKATHWLADRIQELSRQSQAADAAVQQYRAANGLAETANGSSLVDQQMGDISGQLVIARSDLAIKQATYSHVAALARQGRAADISQATTSPLIGTLRGQEADLMRQEADLSTKYGPRNPKLLDIQSQRTNLQSKINEEVNRVVQSVANDVAIAQAHVGSLQGSLNQIEGRSGAQSQLKVKLTQLQSASTSAKSMYEAFLSKLNQTQDQQGIQTPDARIISRAAIPESPSYPNKHLTIGVAIPSGFLLGILFAFIMERLESGFRTTYQIENMLGIPVLATVPEVQGLPADGSVTAADRVIDRPMSSFSESIRGLELALTLSNVDNKPKVIVVTSSVPGEGKTTTAISLARLAARSGLKTIIVDCDLRHPAVAKTLRLEPERGVVEVISGAFTLDQCIIKDPRSEALVLACVTKPASPSDLLGSQATRSFISHLAKVFDLVIIDSAPVLPVHDTKILSQLADTVLFVIRWERTPREGVANGLRALADFNAPVAGVALARADMKRFRYYSYGYQDYYYYNKYYTE